MGLGPFTWSDKSVPKFCHLILFLVSSHITRDRNVVRRRDLFQKVAFYFQTSLSYKFSKGDQAKENGSLTKRTLSLRYPKNKGRPINKIKKRLRLINTNKRNHAGADPGFQKRGGGGGGGREGVILLMNKNTGGGRGVG